MILLFRASHLSTPVTDAYDNVKSAHYQESWVSCSRYSFAGNIFLSFFLCYGDLSDSGANVNSSCIAYYC
jgi:hypothetical protein